MKLVRRNFLTPYPHLFCNIAICNGQGQDKFSYSMSNSYYIVQEILGAQKIEASEYKQQFEKEDFEYKIKKKASETRAEQHSKKYSLERDQSKLNGEGKAQYTYGKDQASSKMAATPAQKNSLKTSFPVNQPPQAESLNNPSNKNSLNSQPQGQFNLAELDKAHAKPAPDKGTEKNNNSFLASSTINDIKTENIV